jgi:hypothetical protein
MPEPTRKSRHAAEHLYIVAGEYRNYADTLTQAADSLVRGEITQDAVDLLVDQAKRYRRLGNGGMYQILRGCAQSLAGSANLRFDTSYSSSQ